MRTESRVTAMATPSSRTIRPTICAPNSELVSDSGMTEDVATGFLPGLAWLPGAGLGTEDGLICGNRLDALPPGTILVAPGMSGSVPTGRAELRL